MRNLVLVLLLAISAPATIAAQTSGQEAFNLNSTEISRLLLLAKSGDVDAAYRLGIYHVYVTHNRPDAIHWLRIAAKGGVNDSLERLATSLLGSDEEAESREGERLVLQMPPRSEKYEYQYLSNMYRESLKRKRSVELSLDYSALVACVGGPSDALELRRLMVSYFGSELRTTNPRLIETWLSTPGIDAIAPPSLATRSIADALRDIGVTILPKESAKIWVTFCEKTPASLLETISR